MFEKFGLDLSIFVGLRESLPSLRRGVMINWLWMCSSYS